MGSRLLNDSGCAYAPGRGEGALVVAVVVVVVVVEEFVTKARGVRSR